MPMHHMPHPTYTNKLKALISDLCLLTSDLCLLTSDFHLPPHRRANRPDQRSAQETNHRAALAQSNPVARAQGIGTRHQIVIDQRALPAQIVQDEGPVIVEYFAMPRCHL